MAKGLEDTSFYRYNRLISLNDVGGDPMRFGVNPEEFHRETQQRSADWPHSMLAGSTHDSKRSEDVRARINVLSEIPDEWRAKVFHWRELNQKFKKQETSGAFSGSEIPSPNDEYLLYQTLIGAWPMGSSAPDESFIQRICAYMIKALREGKERTSWANQNQAYEDGVSRFVESVMRNSEFLADFVPFQKRVSYFGMCNSLSQMLIRLTVPGVPDVYQGNEMWEFNLVDPDNRRAVDYGARHRALQQIHEMASDSQLASLAERLAAHPEDGCIKMYLLWQSLQLRSRAPELFSEGTYVPLNVTGGKSKHVIAFMRQLGELSVVVAVPRLCGQLTRGELRMPVGEKMWGDCQIHLPDGTPLYYRDAFTGTEQHCPHRTLSVADVFARLPFALLTSDARK